LTLHERIGDEMQPQPSEEDYRTIFELVGIGAAQVDPATGCFVRVNPSICEITGYSEEELLDMTFLEVTHSEDRKEDFERFRRFVGGDVLEYKVEKRYVRKDGQEIWVNVDATVIRNEAGQPLRMLVIIQDISEHKEAEEARARLAAIVESSDDAIIGKTLDGLITSWNRGAQKIYGYSKEEVVGKRINILVPPEYPDEIPQILGKIRRGEVVDHYETTRIAKDGRRLEVLLTVSPIKDQAGTVIGASTIARDITERKQAEEETRQVREAERQRMARDLHDEALQDLTYALAQTQLVQSVSEDSELASQLQGSIEALKRAGQGVRAAIYDLRLEGERESTFVELLESLVKVNRRMAPECDIRLEAKESFPSAPLGEEDTELLRILQEALANARRHSGASHVRVAVGVCGDKLWAEVSDDGRGFGRETPTGIGTKGMRERVRELGGDLKITSKPGEGTRVRFEMALQSDVNEPEEEVRILLVEDHASFRQAMTSMLDRESSFSVIGQAESLGEAREILEGVDVAIVDLGLPDGYGGELITELRALNPEAQALVLSASLERSEIARAVECGAAGVLHKSASMDEIAEAVRRLKAGETLLPTEETIELLRLAGSRREEEYEVRRAVARLTPREKEVLQALADGLNSKEIAERLQISMETGRNHMQSIMVKLGVHSRLQALVFALRHRVVKVR
jgi:PAS domain S-box-containing protein